MCFLFIIFLLVNSPFLSLRPSATCPLWWSAWRRLLTSAASARTRTARMMSDSDHHYLDIFRTLYKLYILIYIYIHIYLVHIRIYIYIYIYIYIESTTSTISGTYRSRRWRLKEDIVIRMNGCPNSCGRLSDNQTYYYLPIRFSMRFTDLLLISCSLLNRVQAIYGWDRLHRQGLLWCVVLQPILQLARFPLCLDLFRLKAPGTYNMYLGAELI